VWQFLKRIWPSLSRPARRPGARRVRPGLEVLDRRDLPACGIWLAPGVVTVEGTDQGDRAEVSPWGPGIRVTLDCGDNGAGVDHVAFFGPGAVNRVVFRGLAGDDGFRNDTAVASTAYGGLGNDYLRGGSATDKLFGEDGNDRLIGGAGDDWLIGGAGADLLQGLADNDFLDGGNDGAVDLLFGGDGADNLVWNPGDLRDWIADGPPVPW
jgi:Ca2+-binding RTX toxin-like protein